MAVFNTRLRQLRLEAGMTQTELAIKIKKSKSSVNMYERGDREPGLETLEALADIFNVDIDYLCGKSDIRNRFHVNYNDTAAVLGLSPLPTMKKIPRLGRIACGEPILAEENIEGYDDAPDFVDCDFSLTCEGDSMIGARIYDGDTVYVKLQETVENGQIAVVRIGDETTLKRFYRNGDTVTLMPENPKYAPLTFVKEQINNIRILGRAVAFTSMIK